VTPAFGGQYSIQLSYGCGEDKLEGFLKLGNRAARPWKQKGPV